jgi:hypothetical protein
MVPKLKTTTLLKDLIASDFLIINSSSLYSSNKKSTFGTLNVNKKISTILDPVSVIVGLKQFIRALQYAKNDRKLELKVKNGRVFDVLNSIVVPSQLLSISNNPLLETIATCPKTVVVIDNYFLNDNLLHRNLFLNAFSLLNQINLNRANNLSSYYIKNDLDTLKKIMFISVLIKQIYHNKSISL